MGISGVLEGYTTGLKPVVEVVLDELEVGIDGLCFHGLGLHGVALHLLVVLSLAATTLGVVHVSE